VRVSTAQDIAASVRELSNPHPPRSIGEGRAWELTLRAIRTNVSGSDLGGISWRYAGWPDTWNLRTASSTREV